ncbi:MAG: tetratricopeptide repeat protein [Candidatus Rokubacteria bacterium]|nr:tetratricopeptide repeat protein [Candidatus Rokubacteria bacterium]
MSLIADALKRAQQGIAGRLPPLPGNRSPRSGRGAEGLPGRRVLFIIGFMGVGGTLVIGALWLTTPRKSASLRTAAPPPLIVGETQPAPGSAAEKAEKAKGTKAQASPKVKDETTITDVLAALQLKPEETLPGAPREDRGGVARATRKPDPRREIALQRARDALEGDKPPAPSGGSAPVASPGRAASQEAGPAQAVAKAEATKAGPPPPPPTLEVHASGKEALRWFAEGLRHQREGRYVQAIEEYEKSIAADPRNLEAYNNLGVLFKETGRLDQAAEAFQRALAVDPKYEKALNNLGVVRYLKGQYEEAISLFKRAILINSENLESYTNLGIIYLLAERLEDARGAFERALQLDPKHAETHYNLALLYERRGIWPKAFTHYQRFIELASPKHAALVAKVRERLQALSQRRS